MSQLYPLVTLLLTIFNTNTLTLAQPINIDTNTLALAQPTNTTLRSNSEQYSCADRFAQLSRNGKPENCARAIIAHFPMGASPGVFSHSQGNEDFRLPRYGAVGDCQVSVDLSEGVAVVGTWNEVWTMANTLSTACTNYRAARTPESAVTGGYIVANGIVVMMEKPLDVGNASYVTEE